MSRFHCWQFVLNEEGQPIEDVDISLYLAGTSTVVYIYPSETGGQVVTTVPQTTTDANGFFELWIADSSDTYGYTAGQKFKLSWEKVGITSGSIDNMDILSFGSPVDETDSTNIAKNKYVSNLLAYRWENHRTLTYSDSPHDIDVVDETDTDTTKDKLVSNLLAKDWEDHKDDVTHLVHGLEEVDPYDSNANNNKLVSNLLMNTLLSMATSAVSGAQIRNTQITSWTLSGVSYYADVIHTLNNSFVVITCYDQLTNLIVQPQDIESINPTTIRIWMPVNTIDLEVILSG